ncbi:MAG: DUF5711 family protein [Lachnospiraceae bacterium]|jgi:hypothetical protein|nr:DUF5711 family protein [Lachnospiraceae bacterium]
MNQENENQSTSVIETVNKYFNFKVQIICAAAVLVIISVGVFLYMFLNTWTKIRTLDTYADAEACVGYQYASYENGIIRYGRDGAVFQNIKGKENWNAPYQMKNPKLVEAGESFAIADYGGNDIVVFNKKGRRGEIHTTLPVERMAVSSQGIVAAILKNEESPKVVIYDVNGNVLVEHSASFDGTGYPSGLSLSPDGTIMAVSYVLIKEGKLNAALKFFYFGETGKNAEPEIFTTEYEGILLPELFFMDDKIIVAAGDTGLYFYKIADDKKSAQETSYIGIAKEILGIFHDKTYIALTVKDRTNAQREVYFYKKDASLKVTMPITVEFVHSRYVSSQLILWNEKQCQIITPMKTEKFNGEFELPLQEVIPISGINKYLVIDSSGMKTVRLTN